MNPKTLEALKASIEHWKRNASGNYDGVGARSCALCQRFMSCDTVYNDEYDRHETEPCPVYAHTGQLGCKGTPYPEALMPRKPEHLGDGAYLDDDGFQIWLCANHHANRVVALEPGVFYTFLRYASVRMVEMGYDKDEIVSQLQNAITHVQKTEFK